MRRRTICARTVLILVSWLVVSVVPVLAPAQANAQDQGSGTAMSRRILEVRRKQVQLRRGQAELRRVERLFDKGLMSEADLDAARTHLEELQLGYQEAVLSLLNLQPSLAIEEAIKYQDDSGRRYVRLKVANLTPTFNDEQFEVLNDFEGARPIPEELRTRVIRDIFISLQDPGGDSIERGTTIGLPYEQYIPELRYGEHEELVFQLLRDVASVIVASRYLGEHRELSILLQQADSGTALDISSTQISQEADLGGKVVYGLVLERSSVDVRTYGLEVVGLPRQISWSFVEPESQARLSQLSFPPGVPRQSLELRLFLPEQADDVVIIDRPIEFWAVATDERHQLAVQPGQDLRREDLERSGAGFLQLSVTPRGIGRIEVSALSLFSEVEVGDEVASTLTVINTGTRRLDDIWIRSEAPVGWKVSFEPERISGLGLRQERTVAMTVQPPEEVVVGDYEVRIKTESFSFNRKVPSEDKVFRISVRPRSSLLATGGLLLLLALVIGGGVLAAIRITRR